MAPSAALQSRIKAFEDLQTNGNRTTKLSGGMQPTATPIILPPKPIFDEDLLDSEPTSPSSDLLNSITPLQPVQIDSRASSPAVLGRKSSLILFSELASPLLKPVSSISAHGTGSTSSSSLSDAPRKPQLPPRNKFQAPPLPPRKPSVSSLKAPTPTPTPSSSTPPPLPKRNGSSPPSMSQTTPSGSSFLAPKPHTYPPPRPGPSSSGFTRHAPTSSTSSFHSVSLSSDGGDTLEDSLDGSYEAVSSTVATSPISDHGDFTLLREKQSTSQSSNTFSPSNTIKGSVVRRSPPPLPSYLSPEQQTQHSVKLTSTSVQTSPHRAINMPPDARKRYEDLFDRNLKRQLSQFRSGSGWRGPSLDMWASGDRRHAQPSDERLSGAIIRCIWNCSKLPREQLREIWDECDPDRIGSLDRDSFARGMWRIDEMLRVAQARRKKPPPPPPKVKPIPLTYTPRVIPPPIRKQPILQ